MSLHRGVPNAEKGARYLGLLDQALCNGQWGEVPELARKVEKHAPQRKNLTLAARAECQVVTASHRPTSASSVTTTSIHGLTGLVPQLSEAVAAAGSTHPDDATIASTCLAGIYWLQESPLDAVRVLDAGASQSSAQAGASTLGWLEVCQVKAAYIHATCMEASGRQSEAREYYHAAVLRTPGYRSPELRRWTERLLAKACLYSVKTIPSPSVQDFGETYSAFKTWGDFWERAPLREETAPSGVDIPRIQVWKAYYDLLSTILQHGLVLNPDSQSSEDIFMVPFNSSHEQQVSLKQRQRSEMQHVESTYEALLLGERKFPKASQASTEVEGWAQQVIANWGVYTGPNWTDAELGEGGKTAVSRSVLDILYRAATKSFHSTPILRHLFTVHAALGEFDLALHAFESYLEIMDKGKARAEKTGKHEFGLDDDDTAMLTAAEAVRVLCRYGDREHVERAVDITGSMQKWMGQKRPSSADSNLSNRGAAPTSSSLRAATLAANYRALGVSLAQWAQLTYESEARSRLLSDASKHLVRAQRHDSSSIDTAYALALVLAESRDVSGAIEVVRGVIESNEDAALLNGDLAHSQSARKRQLIPLWHLLALCLTAQDDFTAAALMCQAAYKQFGDPNELFGHPIETMLRDSENMSHSRAGVRGLVDHMEGCEKENVLQVKMTEIMLVELTEGAETAVDLADELLGLYSRLFGSLDNQVTMMKPPQTAVSAAPSRLGGTLRSIAGSIRPRSRRRSNANDTIRAQSVGSASGSMKSPNPEITDRTNGQSVAPPISITVTNEDSSPSEKPHGHHLHLPHIPHHPFHGRNHGGDAAVDSRSASETGTSEPVEDKSSPARSPVDDGLNADQPMREIAHNEPHNELPLPSGHAIQPPVQDVRLPTAQPASQSALSETHLLPMHERRHKFGVLVQTWLFIAGLYIRAEVYDDAQSAVQNAAKFVEMLEVELAGSESGINARRLFHKGWGGGESIDRLWADVWSTKAHLALARQHPFEALAQYDQALSHFPDHPAGIIGIANLLMDVYEEKLPAEEPLPLHRPLPTASGALINEAKPTILRSGSSASKVPSRRPSLVSEAPDLGGSKQDPTPAELNRLAARDRAYILLLNLTKLGAGWNDSEAWLTLARAHELSGEIGKAKRALWWVVELEDYRPMRPWKDVTHGAYAL